MNLHINMCIYKISNVILHSTKIIIKYPNGVAKISNSKISPKQKEQCWPQTVRLSLCRLRLCGVASKTEMKTTEKVKNPEINLHIFNHLIFNKGVKTCIQKGQSFQQMVLHINIQSGLWIAEGKPVNVLKDKAPAKTLQITNIILCLKSPGGLLILDI